MIEYENKKIEKKMKEIEKEIKSINGERREVIKKLQVFDVRDAVVKEVLKNEEKASKDFNIYQENDIVIKTFIGKKWAAKKKMDYDYDSSLRSNYIYWKTNFESNKSCLIKHAHGYEYVICSGDIQYSGDTMNSWKTTLIEFFRLYGDKYLKYLTVNCTGRNYGKWRIPGENPAKDWDDFLSKTENYRGNDLPLYITEFLDVVYTMGNFIPVPQTPMSFNKGRYAPTKDYWDLILLSIYEYYMGRGGRSPLLCLFAEEKIRNWLDEFGDWNTFVKKNYMQPFVSKIGKEFGEPRELWDGHFDAGNILPKEWGQFEQFFVNAKVRILERGRFIAEELYEKLNEEKNKVHF